MRAVGRQVGDHVRDDIEACARERVDHLQLGVGEHARRQPARRLVQAADKSKPRRDGSGTGCRRRSRTPPGWRKTPANTTACGRTRPPRAGRRKRTHAGRARTAHAGVARVAQRAVVGVDKRLERVDDEIQIRVTLAAAVPGVGPRVVFVGPAALAVGDRHDDGAPVTLRMQGVQRLVHAPFAGETGGRIEHVLAVLHVHHRIAFAAAGVVRRQVQPDAPRALELRDGEIESEDRHRRRGGRVGQRPGVHIAPGGHRARVGRGAGRGSE